MEEKKKENNKSTENLRLRESEGTEQDLRAMKGDGRPGHGAAWR